MPIIAVAQPKGGVGKTTLAIHLAVYLVRQGRTVCIVDADPNACTTSWLLGSIAPQDTLSDLLVFNVPAIELARSVPDWGLRLLAGNQRTSDGYEFLAMTHKPLKAIAQRLQPLAATTDYVFIDMPPGLGTGYLEMLCAAGLVLVPTQLERLSLESTRLLAQVCATLTKRSAPSPRLLGIVPTMVRTGFAEHKIQMQCLLDTFGLAVWPALPVAIEASESCSFGTTLFDHAPTAQITRAFAQVGLYLLQVLEQYSPPTIDNKSVLPRPRRTAARLGTIATPTMLVASANATTHTLTQPTAECSAQHAEIADSELENRISKRAATCAYCHATIRGRPLTGRYCSIQCSIAARTKTCIVCGETYLAEEPEAASICSDYCASAHLDRPCKKCGKRFRPSSSRRLYCSKECHNQAEQNRPSNRPASRFTILRRDKFTCFYCGKKSYEDGREMHVDHVVPRARGGQSLAGNLVTACRQCNLEKSQTPLSEELLATLRAEITRRNQAVGIADEQSFDLGEKAHASRQARRKRRSGQR
jgi:chromosome partitioning protein